VLTRPAWTGALQPSLHGAELQAQLHSCADAAADLRTIAALARAGDDAIVVINADIVTHREALAGLLADPRIATGILTSTRRVIGRPFTYRTRSVRGRVLSAASPYHAVHAPNAKFLGVVKVASAHLEELTDAAERLAAICGPPLPASWQEELDSKEDAWRLALAQRALASTLGDEESEAEDRSLPAGPLELEAAAVTLSEDDEAELRCWLAAAPEDVTSLLLVGLVRSNVHVGVSHLRTLFWTRPLSPRALESAAEEITQYDEDRVLLDSAVKKNDGFFTTFFVSPYSKYLARWAARRGWTPNAVTTVSIAIGVAAALAFATGGRAGLIAGAVLLQLAFTTDCVDGQLARYTRTFSRLGAWLDSIFDRTKEYAVFAGLAVGASRAGNPVWLLAASALALQTVRHAIDFSYPTAQHQALGAARQPPLEQPQDAAGSGRSPARTSPPSGQASAGAAPAEAGSRRGPVRKLIATWRFLDRRPWVRWAKKVVAFPIGERFAVISLTAALATPRTTFVVLLAWGGAAACYTAGGRVLRSLYR
jgi:CDP-alcohol phosphatidyltransferase-like enzyme